VLLKDWPRLRESRNGAGEMFWEVNRGGALLLPGAQVLFVIRMLRIGWRVQARRGLGELSKRMGNSEAVYCSSAISTRFLA
jgi:hypothetical protein